MANAGDMSLPTSPSEARSDRYLSPQGSPDVDLQARAAVTDPISSQSLAQAALLQALEEKQDALLDLEKQLSQREEELREKDVRLRAGVGQHERVCRMNIMSLQAYIQQLQGAADAEEDDEWNAAEAKLKALDDRDSSIQQQVSALSALPRCLTPSCPGRHARQAASRLACAGEVPGCMHGAGGRD